MSVFLLGLTFLIVVGFSVGRNPYDVIHAEEYAHTNNQPAYNSCASSGSTVYYISGKNGASYLYNNLQFNSSKAELIRLNLIGLGSGYVDLALGDSFNYRDFASFPVQKTKGQACGFTTYSVFLQSQPDGTTQDLLLSFRSTETTTDFVYVDWFQFYFTVSPDSVQ